MAADTISQNRYYFTKPTRSFFYHLSQFLCYATHLLYFCCVIMNILDWIRNGSWFCRQKKLGRITRFSAKFIVLYQPYLRILGEDILVEPIHTFSACSWRRDHDGLYFLKKCIFLSRVSCEAHFTRISSSLEKTVACRWRASIFSNVKKQVSAIQPIEPCVWLIWEWWTSLRSRDHHGIFFLNKERVCV